jgi:hypothetical protein
MDLDTTGVARLVLSQAALSGDAGSTRMWRTSSEVIVYTSKCGIPLNLRSDYWRLGRMILTAAPFESKLNYYRDLPGRILQARRLPCSGHPAVQAVVSLKETTEVEFEQKNPELFWSAYQLTGSAHSGTKR